MNRRDFITQTSAALLLSRTGAAQTSPKLSRVAVMTSYFGTRMPDTRDKGTPAVVKDLNLLDFPEMIADRVHLHNLELQQMYFPTTEASYFKEFKARLAKTKSRVTNM